MWFVILNDWRLTKKGNVDLFVTHSWHSIRNLHRNIHSKNFARYTTKFFRICHTPLRIYKETYTHKNFARYINIKRKWIFVIGPVHKGTNHVPKAVSECDSDPFLIWKPDFTLTSGFWNAFWIVIRVESLILRTCECKACLERDSCVRILEMRSEAMYGSISADWAVGTKYYLAVHRSCSWLGRHLQCLWTHIVQITIPITKQIVIRNDFRNVIHSFVNRPIHSSYSTRNLQLHLQGFC